MEEWAKDFLPVDVRDWKTVIVNTYIKLFMPKETIPATEARGVLTFSKVI